ncbi:MAG: hypothetical protein IPN91_09280 [Holophagaceae bacterium]|uniref:Bacterial transcriptional activator domain-containing protein n=1 Tax=Candidatus Geothrix odensensis TaxID=2954440 RepID=A0A936F2D2_9BACT|nr:hypothetical protein [Candidatus Geothrix odensensis]
MIRTAPILLVSILQAQAPAFRADLEAGRYLKVLAEAEQRLREHPSDAPAWAAKSQALSSLLRFPEALSAAERAVSLKPDLADAPPGPGPGAGWRGHQAARFQRPAQRPRRHG